MSAHVISLLNMKGGVGKTTLAVNLAYHMSHREGKKVLLIDFDPQFNATQYTMHFKTFDTHRKSAGTIADLLIDQPLLQVSPKKKKKDIRKVIYNLYDKPASGARLDLLPAELTLAYIVKNPSQMDSRLIKVLEPVRNDYDFIFIDCAPTDSVLTTMALNASNFVLTPMRPDRFSILGYFNLRETIQTFRDNCTNPNDVKELGIVFTQVMNNSTVERQSISEVEAAAAKSGDYVFTNALQYSTSFARSISDRTPIFATAYARDEVKNASRDVANELQTRIKALAPSV